MASVLLCQGTALALPLKDNSVHTVCTSPPYYALRRYDCGPGELGLEPTPEAYVEAMVQVFREVRRVLHPTGTLWINMGDSYNAAGRNGHGTRIGAKQGTNRASATGQDACRPTSTTLGEKQLLGMPWRVAFALQQEGWILRSDIIWDKPSCMPESVQDRPTRSHEYVFLFSKQARYFYDAEAVKERIGEPTRRNAEFRGVSVYKDHIADGESNHAQRPEGQSIAGAPKYTGRNARTVWRIASEGTSFAHFATFPPALVRRCLLAGAPTQVCSTCAAPYRRTMERTTEVASSHNGSRFDTGKTAAPHGQVQAGLRYVSSPGDLAPTCACQHASMPATVLDPFCGAGTTLLVARELGHHAIGIDLSYPYLHDIARERLGLAALHAWTHGQQAPTVTYDDLPLFGG